MGTPLLSVGLLLYRRVDGDLQVLLAHMGGPFWSTKDDHAWTIPKGLREDDDHDLLAVALREFAEEMGSAPADGPTTDLGPCRAGRKTNHVFARQADFDASQVVSNTFEMEWPPKSGRTEVFPEVDRAAWMRLDDARQKLVKGMLPFLDRLEAEVAP
ncbi:MAG: NUDIX domain-containing protein [Acidimicrobiales bacterium]